MRGLSVAVATLLLACGLAGAQDNHNWRSLKADDGSEVKIDMTSLSQFNANAATRAADVVLYFVEGKTYNPVNMRRYIFYSDEDHYRDVTQTPSPTLYAAPRSLAAQISAIVCAPGAKDKNAENAAKEMPPPESAPRWQDYCKSFSEEACARIRRVVEAKITPSYCKPGFAVAPTGLSEEQLRICYVMPPLRTAAAPAPSQARPLPSQTTPVRTFSARQIEAIRMTTIAGLAGDYCLEIVGADYALGQELINAGIEVSDFGAPEYERIRRDAKAALDSEPNASRCDRLWNLFGSGGSYGRELVRRRRPSDTPYVSGKR